LGLALDEKYHGAQVPGKLKFGVSGCANQCAETCIKDIGVVGFPKGWRVFAGGNGGVNPRLSQELARDLTTEQVLNLIDTIITHYVANASPKQRLGAMIDKIGFDVFKAAIVA
jgi:NAD(P)H-nitrite reductase large subunit